MNFLRYFSEYYHDTDKSLIKQILSSPFVHVDETRVNIQGIDQYVWAFTDGTHAVFKLTQTREATIVHEVLAGYQGILVSDFYGGYDSVKCKQQKCWVHLIGDFNDDLWRAPFDEELEAFLGDVRNLITPIFESVAKYGLKRVHLNKYKKKIEDFYYNTIKTARYRSRVVNTYQKRFLRYKDSLFSFLEFDGIPWNNNTAERALRHLAVQRKISGSFYESFTGYYLLLLGLMQTCRFQDKPLLRFLLSGEKDIDRFKRPKRTKNSFPITKNDSVNNS